MSIITEKSPKDCASKQPLHKLNKKLIIHLSTISLTLLSCILLVWLSLHPSKPKFSVTGAHINRLNSSILLTIVSHNPNMNAGIYYDQISTHASYKGLIITSLTYIPPFYQDHAETNVLSAYLVGDEKIVGLVLGYHHQVQHDKWAGSLGLGIEINDKLRWKVGNWKSGVHGFNVNCYISMPFGAKASYDLGYVQLQGMECSTTM